MPKRRGNPNWGKPEPFAPTGPSTFEHVVKKLGLSPHEYQDSTALKSWVLKNKNHKYVPQDLLDAWGIVADTHSE